MHDGRWTELSEVIEHYSELDEDPAVGHREETLRPMHLTREDQEDIEAFLHALSSPVENILGLSQRN